MNAVVAACGLTLGSNEGAAQMSNLGVSSKLNVGREFLGWHFELGRKRADDFLREHFYKLGNESSTIIEQRFL